ncbi:MAG TPA: hypothetical protein VMU17_03385 [Elusimicrobiota bacterium]|nr:hypothetical protein [Elusimicrobiota bacterium]
MLGCRSLRAGLFLLAMSCHARAADQPSAAPENQAYAQEPEQLENPVEGEGSAADTATVVTPATIVPEKKPYDQARDELLQATTLWKNGDAAQTCDVALQAYEDLLTIRHRPKKQRARLHEERHQAATLYILSCIRTIHNYVDDSGNTAAAREEGRERLTDLHDVARDYQSLDRMLDQAATELGAKPQAAK